MRLMIAAILMVLATLGVAPAWAADAAHTSELDLVLPDLCQVTMMGMSGRVLLFGGLIICLLGLGFGLRIFTELRNMPVHRAMLEISELIYETCKTYLITQGKFILLLELFIGTIMVIYFGLLRDMSFIKVAIIIIFSLIGIGGSYLVAWFGIRVNTFANSRTAFAALEGRPFPCYAIPLKAGMSIGTLLISIELLLMLLVLLFIPADLAYPCFIGFAIGESLGASALRIAGGIFTKIADIGSDLMKIVFNIKEDDARNPGRDRRLHRRQRRRLGRPDRRRLRDLRRDRRRAHLLHPARRAEPRGAGTAHRLAVRHARHDDRRQRPLVRHQRRHPVSQVRQRPRTWTTRRRSPSSCG